MTDLLAKRIGSIDVLLRPGTPDLEVAQTSLGGEFDLAIKAARPLDHGLIIDAGGYIGTAAIAFARAFPSATVVTLEPSSANFSVLKENTKAYPNIVTLNVALSPTEGRNNLRNRGTGEWGFTLVESPADQPDAAVIETVETTTVPALMRQFRREGIDIVKLDIEGGEHALLAESPPWIAQTKVLIAELHDRIVPGCVETFNVATAGRRNRKAGEKFLSVRKRGRWPWLPALGLRANMLCNQNNPASKGN